MEVNYKIIALIFIGFIVATFLYTNIRLITALRRRGPDRSLNMFHRINKVLQDPWFEENQQIDELKKKMAEVKEQEQAEEITMGDSSETPPS